MAARKTRSLDVTVASQRRRQILEAAKKCIAEEGTERTTMRRVAERAGISHGTIVYYFKSRRRLIDAALMDMASSYMDGLYSGAKPGYGPDGPVALARLVRAFLDRNNGSASFVVKMIDAGLHDLELRDVHDEFVRYGQDLIERSIRVGMDLGEFRQDIDPELAAKLIHSVLIWWGSELAGAAISREQAARVGKLALELLQPSAASEPRTLASAEIDVVELVRASLLADPALTDESALALSEAFQKMYELTVDRSATRATL